MGILEDIRGLQQSGLDDSMIVSKLQEQGFSYRDISDAIAQSKIQEAVGGQNSEIPNQESPVSNFETQNPGMQQSIMQTPQTPAEEQEYYPSYDQNVAPLSQTYVSQKQDYVSAALSSDTIAEISEQIVSEKLSDMRKKMEKIITSKTEIDARTESIEERLKRIEKIIDTLQVSVLRKVGDYVTNVDDIKKELIETQKTIGKVLSSHSKK
ncbi:hypothetical protein EXS72_01685 [Candidatus Pacearchaeota archaeon]|nr:hypothetical protein [Candidatus Pacearchaeota archaeon]